jgi:hypothetical protein
MAAGDSTTAARLERMGISLLTPSHGLNVLGGILAGQDSATLPPVISAVPFRCVFVFSFGRNRLVSRS